MDAFVAIVGELQQLAGYLQLAEVLFRQDGSGVVLHRGVGIIIIVAVRVKHEQRSRGSKEPCHVVIRGTHVFEGLHLLTRERYALPLLKTAQGYDVLTRIELFLKAHGIVVAGVLGIHTETELSRAFVLRDEAFNTPALCSRVEVLRLLRLDIRERLDHVTQRRDAPHTALHSVGIRDVDDIGARHVHPLHVAVIRQIGEVVQAGGDVVRAVADRPQRNGEVELVPLDIHEAVAEGQLVHGH